MSNYEDQQQAYKTRIILVVLVFIVVCIVGLCSCESKSHKRYTTSMKKCVILDMKDLPVNRRDNRSVSNKVYKLRVLQDSIVINRTFSNSALYSKGDTILVPIYNTNNYQR